MAPVIQKKKNPASKEDIQKDFVEAINLSFTSYKNQVKNNRKLRLIDIFGAILVVVGIFQIAFVGMIQDNYPFNAFLAGFIICVGQFVLLMCLRLQLTHPFEGISKSKAFGEFIIASLILHFTCLHFIN
ncbi:similar to Saccharomyces cerevisiae YOR103C OST2 Epsilon subunit of the oligosaccharyltransferase complex of the ER lumen [Maudiozyma barnettii]|uniref:Dolichyl-diphosphooligosaccharide--protein glycosyltransferase subunit OST2 n=1 Tax=Maudiozyma barnettii TaxID=61262 RepID=A0A8H2VC15_9SACH|nr:dolichyl-diphosphooligosaccharide-protein glycotransferase [Kazachstania barnettii]CAB4252510.1 similar to Saccharomyces cerevisiae YOR103C OST2 Epsilon subunit of the oligosaccharyltransferase complex of the ER lumen [Kazachstania barnettii]CAD1779244.1 similar to Saccharomyces cerevisiae YOR103C OST2 Epsilon subunit of the oligosaccharyltransferase complex of the ER lumen [Kazachstania barnettii]